MKSMKPVVILAGVALLIAGAFVLRAQRIEATPPLPPPLAALAATPAPTLIELGSDRCTSCRAMFPVLEELRNSHCDLNVRFVDVWDHPEEGARLGVTTIPTQVLLAPDGSELTRHTGFWSADAIRAAFASRGHELAVATTRCDR